MNTGSRKIIIKHTFAAFSALAASFFAAFFDWASLAAAAASSAMTK